MAIVTVALGLGPTTAMFSVVDGVLLRALPYRAPGQLVTIWETFPHWRGQPVLDLTWDRIGLSYQELIELARHQRSFEGVAAAYWAPPTRVAGGIEPIELPVARGSASLLPLLGIHTELGRWFLPGEEGLGAPPIAVISHGLWQSRYGEDPRAVGSIVELNGTAFTVVGILPRESQFASVGPRKSEGAAIWVPIGSQPGDLVMNSQNYEVVARIRAGVSMAQAREEAERLVVGDRDRGKRGVRILTRHEAKREACARRCFS